MIFSPCPLLLYSHCHVIALCILDTPVNVLALSHIQTALRMNGKLPTHQGAEINLSSWRWWLPCIARVLFVLAIIFLIHLNCLKVKAFRWTRRRGSRGRINSMIPRQSSEQNQRYFCLVILQQPQQQSVAPSERHFVTMGMLALSPYCSLYSNPSSWAAFM